MVLEGAIRCTRAVLQAFGLTGDALRVLAMIGFHYSHPRRRVRKSIIRLWLERVSSEGRLAVRPRSCASGIWLRPFDEGDVQALLEVFVRRCYPVPTGDLLIDAGANIGMYSRLALEEGGVRRLVAVEPDPANLALLKRNLSAWSNAEIVGAALCAWEGSRRFVRGSASNVGRVEPRGTGASDAGPAALEVRAITPASPELPPLEAVDCVKLDIEGAEEEVLPVLVRSMRSGARLVGELHGLERIERFLPLLGPDCRVLEETEQTMMFETTL